MANNIITEENLTLIRDLIPNIVYQELQGSLEVDEAVVEVPTIEPVTESDEILKARAEIQDLTMLLELVSGRDKKKAEKEIQDLNDLINLLTEK